MSNGPVCSLAEIPDGLALWGPVKLSAYVDFRTAQTGPS